MCVMCDERERSGNVVSKWESRGDGRRKKTGDLKGFQFVASLEFAFRCLLSLLPPNHLEREEPIF